MCFAILIGQCTWGHYNHTINGFYPYHSNFRVYFTYQWDGTLVVFNQVKKTRHNREKQGTADNNIYTMHIIQ